jgi:hypothetical protein
LQSWVCRDSTEASLIAYALYQWFENLSFPQMSRNYFTVLVGLFLACSLGVEMTQAVGPGVNFKLQPKYTSLSPDKTTTVEQYAKIGADGSYAWEFWARHQGKQSLLEPEQPDYAAGFRFTNDSQWLVRMQKNGAGYARLYLYHLGPKGFVTATAKPLSDLAWDYFKSLPDCQKLGMPDMHITAGLVEGTDDNYRSVLGENWPDSRYLVIYLSGQVTRKRDQNSNTLSLFGWHCRYDLEKGAFDVPPDFKDNNAKAITPRSE